MRRVRRLPSRTPEAHCVWYLWGPVRPSLFVRPFAACGRGETGPGGAFVRRDVCVFESAPVLPRSMRLAPVHFFHLLRSLPAHDSRVSHFSLTNNSLFGSRYRL